MAFAKGHGAQNDFIVLPDPRGRLALSDADVVGLCDRRTGIGADGVLRVVRCADDPEAVSMRAAAEWFMDYRNADGSRGAMCGKGIRVLARYLVDTGLCRPGTQVIATRAGVRRVHVPEGREEITVEMGEPRFPAADSRMDCAEIRTGSRSWHGLPVDMGNPHAVAFVADPTQVGDLRTPPVVGPAGIFPHGVTVEFVGIRGPGHLTVRVHERGVGETRACGTGACAAVAAFRRKRGAAGPARYTVDMPGGRLHVDVDGDGRLRLGGPAVIVARGTVGVGGG
ncbi:diaminopimelate epimerase [Streptomyces fulvoviolaceus]|uniref:diaminopimelate epimerase n=1 Tax=Streptomyces fulvoviolaceus TaxID=285535 RepID=UPI0028F6D761|nr:diaminopimelate epimerase [Streptomyces fulvoviolaceus]